MSNVLVSLDKVSRSYDGGRIGALDNLSLDIERGTFMSIVGPSGSGKSTLLHLISGLDSPDRGSVYFEGIKPASSHHWSRIRARRIGLVFQAFHLLPTLSVLENVQIPMFGIVNRPVERRSRALDLVSLVGLAKRANDYPGELSGGERQRVAIARALANDPDLLIADEPTGNLDSGTSKEILDLLMDSAGRNKGTLIVVTHDNNIARRGDRIIRLLDGRIVDRTEGS